MIKSGIPAEKVVLGIPTYGATYKINPNQVPKIHGSHLGAGDAGPITKEKGYLAYSEVSFTVMHNCTFAVIYRIISYI